MGKLMCYISIRCSKFNKYLEISLKSLNLKSDFVLEFHVTNSLFVLTFLWKNSKKLFIHKISLSIWKCTRSYCFEVMPIVASLLTFSRLSVVAYDDAMSPGGHPLVRASRTASRTLVRLCNCPVTHIIVANLIFVCSCSFKNGIFLCSEGFFHSKQFTHIQMHYQRVEFFASFIYQRIEKRWKF